MTFRVFSFWGYIYVLFSLFSLIRINKHGDNRRKQVPDDDLEYLDDSPEGEGKYYLDTIGDRVYTTDGYELFILYLKLFYPDRYEMVMYPPLKKSIDNRNLCQAPANHESFLKGIQQEKKLYDLGYVPKLVEITHKDGSISKGVRWVSDPEKAQFVLNNSKVVKHV